MINPAVKAALLPILEPIAQTGLIAGILASKSGQAGTATLDVVEITGEQTNKVHFAIGAGIQEQGTVGSDPVSSQLVLQPTPHLGGPDAPEDLALNFDGKVLHVDGRLGTVEARLTGQLTDAQGGTSWHLEGTLDGEAYMVDSVLQNAPPKPGQPTPGTLTVRGKLGTADISKDYTWVTTDTGNEETTTAHGSGSVAGVPEQIDAVYHFVGALQAPGP